MGGAGLARSHTLSSFFTLAAHHRLTLVSIAADLSRGEGGAEVKEKGPPRITPSPGPLGRGASGQETGRPLPWALAAIHA